MRVCDCPHLFCCEKKRKKRELGSKVDRQPEGEVARQAKFFQPTQSIPNPIRDRSGRPGITQDVIGSVLQIDQDDLVSRKT